MDRGFYSVESFLLLLALKVSFAKLAAAADRSYNQNMELCNAAFPVHIQMWSVDVFHKSAEKCHP